MEQLGRSTAILDCVAFDGYQWLLDGEPLAGETGESYTPGEASVGHQLSCEITATYALLGTTTVAASAPVAVIAYGSGPTGPTGLPWPLHADHHQQHGQAHQNDSRGRHGHVGSTRGSLHLPRTNTRSEHAIVPAPLRCCSPSAHALGTRLHVKTVGGFKSVPLSRRGKRDEIIALTGQPDVPLLVLDDGTTVQGTRAIVEWAAAHSTTD